MIDLERVKNTLKRHEGVRKTLYTCSSGYPTVGVGHNLQTNPLSDLAIDRILMDDIASTILDCGGSIKGFSKYPIPVQEALINLVFNMGISKVLQFKRTLKYLQGGYWIAAADELLDSNYAKQVGQRAIEVSNMIRGCAET